MVVVDTTGLCLPLLLRPSFKTLICAFCHPTGSKSQHCRGKEETIRPEVLGFGMLQYQGTAVSVALHLAEKKQGCLTLLP